MYKGMMSDLWFICMYLSVLNLTKANIFTLTLLVDFRFEEKEHVSGTNNVKSSVQRGIRAKLIDEYPHIEDYLDQILPKKSTLMAIKW